MPTDADCRACGACCREAFEQVSISPQEAVIEQHPTLVRFRNGAFELARRQDRCAALVDATEGYSCTIYADRPRSCRAFEAGSERCRAARRRVGLHA
jgi:Fe-S-cluster containining protein